MKRTVFQTITDLLVIALGAALFALSVTLLLDPYGIVPGGVTGIAMLLCALFPVLPLGMTVLVLNIPLFLLGWRLLGHRFLLYTGFGTLVCAVLIDGFARLPLTVDTEPLLAGVFGGLLMGAGLGLVFLKGATTGGSDIIARLLKIPLPHIQIGKLMLAFDGCVVVAAGFVFGSVNHMLYAVITLFIGAKTLDGILYGLNVERLAFIISDRVSDIVEAISARLGRGVTLLHGEGAYTGRERKIVLCAVKRQQITDLKNLVRESDPAAFIILTEANEVLGEGFTDYDKGL
ncbi:MAG: YitT family protein [Oscillospiraceae bacterium]|nr:YitT family protein [Oscillospiraceae bacterium]